MPSKIDDGRAGCCCDLNLSEHESARPLGSSAQQKVGTADPSSPPSVTRMRMTRAEYSIEKRRRVEVTRQIIAEGGSLRDAAQALGMERTAHYQFCKRAGLVEPRQRKTATNWREKLATANPQETAYQIAKRFDRDPRDVARAATTLGIDLAKNLTHRSKQIDWDAELSKALEQGEYIAAVAHRLGCKPGSVRAAAKRRNIKLPLFAPSQSRLQSKRQR